MSCSVDRPTAMHNGLRAVTADHPFEEEEHPGPDLLKHENTARNRINRQRTRDKIRNISLERLYDGTFTFFLAWHFFIAAASRCSLPSFRTPIRPYKGGELKSGAVALLFAEASCAVSTVFSAVFDALCAVCELPPDLDEADDEPQILPAPVRFPASLSPAARRRARFGHRTAHSRAFRPPHSPQPSCGLCASATAQPTAVLRRASGRRRRSVFHRHSRRCCTAAAAARPWQCLPPPRPPPLHGRRRCAAAAAVGTHRAPRGLQLAAAVTLTISRARSLARRPRCVTGQRCVTGLRWWCVTQ